MSQISTEQPFQFKSFSIHQDRCAMKVGTDGVLLGAWASVSDCRSILDIGTGTGLIALMLAQRQEKALVHALDIDEQACEQARQNILNSPWSNRMEVFHVPIQDYQPIPFLQYDLIVSNPPFFSGGVFSATPDRTAVRHTTKMAHQDLLGAVRTLLAPDGLFSVILPLMEGLRFIELARVYGLQLSRQCEVKPLPSRNVERLLLTFRRTSKSVEKETLILQEEAAERVYTEAYKKLTASFYLNF